MINYQYKDDSSTYMSVTLPSFMVVTWSVSQEIRSTFPSQNQSKMTEFFVSICDDSANYGFEFAFRIPIADEELAERLDKLESACAMEVEKDLERGIVQRAKEK
ncbi:hypothetical protein HAX54_001889 [Datura stramonium]|uniref:Uncharacterized protein n=1 Tax=Datura stramonium TaxID=4076 RepID=A0ABS8RSS4_DATST|nr:hypothetical protein [Datura stramonium]